MKKVLQVLVPGLALAVWVVPALAHPGAYSAPFTLYGSHAYAKDTDLMEYICNENNLDVEHIVGKDPRNKYSRAKGGQ